MTLLNEFNYTYVVYSNIKRFSILDELVKVLYIFKFI